MGPISITELIEELTKFPSDTIVSVDLGGKEGNVVAIDGEDPGHVWLWCK